MATAKAAEPGAAADGTGPAVGAGAPKGAGRRSAEAKNFDRRTSLESDPAHRPAPALIQEGRREAVARLQAAVPGVQVAFDEVLGSPASIASTQALLTGPGGAGGAVPTGRVGEFAADDPNRVVKGFVAEHAALFGFGPGVLAEARVTRDYETVHNGLRTTVWQQELEGLRIFESTFQAHVTKRGELVNVASRLVPEAGNAAHAGTPNAAALRAQPVIDARAAVSAAAATLGEKVPPARIVESGPAEGPSRKQQFRSAQLLEVGAEYVWLPLDETALRLCWEVIFVSKARGEMFRALVDAETGETLVRQGLTENISDASYRVFTSDSPTPFSPGHATPSSVQPAQVPRTLVTTPALNTTASPDGWITDGVNETRGNNVDAHTDTNADNIADLPRPQGAAGRVFDFPLDLTQAPSTYREAAVTQLFYLCNFAHDRLYELGFTEAAGNFQITNFGRGGLGNDPVQADAQDGSGTDNANFSTPPDGSAGRLQMFLWTGPTPDRDGDFDAEVVLHEYTHGLSNRLVGGGVGISALQSRGMGEGWSDFYGLALLAEAGDDIHGNWARGGYSRYGLSGTFAENYYYGGRRYPYSTNLATNPLTFKDIDPAQADPHTGIPRHPLVANTADQVHNQGNVWCVTLWDVRANLITKYGFTVGNELTLQLVTDGMKLSPANPNFLQARDGILQADLVNNGGANRSELWAAFAKRGMGASASSPASSATAGLVEAYDPPDDLSITPVAAVLFKGEVGGPFTPSAQSYTLTNTGAASRFWTVTDNQPWLTLNAVEGTLAPGASRTVTAALTSAANSLPNGTHTAIVTFTNRTSGVVFNRTITLRVGQVDYFTELFDTTPHDLDNQSFLFTPNTSPSGYAVERQAATAFPTDPTGGTVLTIAHDSFVLATLTGGQQVRLYGTSYGSFYVGANGYITFGAGDSVVTESLASHFVRPRISALMRHLDPGGQITWKQTADRVAVTWLNVRQYTLADANSFQIEMFFDGRIRITNLAIAATGGLIGLSRGLGVPADFVESDFSGYSNLSLALTLPATASEAGGSVTGTLLVSPTPASALTVALTSSDPTEATVPATVLVPAGQGSVTFPVTLVDDTVLDGTQRAVVTATAPTYAASTVFIDVQDSETAILTLSLPATAAEGGANPQGSVSVSAPPATNVSVALVSANPAEVTVPASVTILAGQTSATFTAGIVDDNRLDGTVTTALTAQVANWTSGTASIAVADNDAATLAISLPGVLREGDGTRTGTVQLGGTISTALTVSLSSNDTSELTVPASVTVPAGAASVNFIATIINDTLADGAQPVQLAASATGFGSATTTVSVADNDAHHFTIAPVGGTQLRNAAFNITVTAQDVNGATITNYNSAVTLTGTVPVTPVALSKWGSGVFTGPVTATAYGTGVVLTVDDGQGHTGVSNAFNVIYGPVTRLAWSPIGALQNVDAPFAVTVRAVDAAGNAVPTFAGFASLAAVQPGLPDVLPIAPVETGDFVAGEWTGNVSVPFAATALRLRATADALTTESDTFAVTAALPPSSAGTVLAEDFESGVLNPAYWLSTGTGTFRTQVATAFSPHGGTRHLTMDSSADGTLARNEATLTVNLAGRTGVVLKFWAAGYSDEASGPPTSPFTGGADFDGVAISADGVTWWEVQALRSLPSTYAQFTVDLDAAIAARGISYGSAFKIRFNQYDDFGLTTDGIVIDDILLTANVPPSGLTVTLPAQVTEGAGLVQGSVSVPVAPTADLVLALSSKAAAKITVPPTVTIPAGQTSAVLPLTVLDDRYIDGTKAVVITAAAPGFLETGATVQVLDNDGGVLTLTLPATAAENGGPITGTLRLSTPALRPLTVVPLTAALVSDNPAAALPPASVTVPRGAVSVPFTVTIPDDTVIDGDQLARFTASLSGWVSATAAVLVQDNEPRQLAVTIPARFRETDAPKTGTVTLSGTFPTDLTVALASSDTSEITVPASVVIPAGLTSAAFAIAVQDDLLADGAQPFTITASAATFTAGTASGEVRDNEAHHFTFAPIASPQAANGPVPAIVTARDPLDAVLTDYSGAITLSATGSGGPLAVTTTGAGGFINGVWNGSAQLNALASGVLLTATAASGATGSSNAFNLVAGQIDRFVWDAVPTPQTLDTPFTVTVRAVDAGGATVPAYNGIANLAVVAPTENSLVGTNSTIINTTLPAYNYDGRSESLYLASELGGPARITALTLHISTLRLGGEILDNLTIRLKHTALANLSTMTTWDNAGWTQVYRATTTVSALGWMTFNFTPPFDYNGTGNLLVDISFDRATSNRSDLYVRGSSTAAVLSRYGGNDGLTTDPLAWTGATPSLNSSTQRADLRLTMLRETPIRPPLSGAFASGVWTGQVSVPMTGAALSLKAQAGAVSGTGNAFAVNPPTPPLNGGASVFAEDFESGTLNPLYWAITGTGNFHTINSNLNTPHGGARHLTMDAFPFTGSYVRNEATLTVNLAGRTGVVLSFWAREFSDEPHGPPASPFPAAGADFDGVAISADGGANWYEVQALRTLTTSYAQLTVNLDAALAARGLSYGTNFKIRFNQYGFDSISSDGIAIDDILLAANPLPGYAINAPAQVTEGLGTVPASLSLGVAVGTDTVVNLTSSAPAEITVPAVVTIPAGQTSASFPLTVLDDGIVDGSRTVAIFGTSPGQLPRSAFVTVLDNDTLPLGITASATIAENATGQTGTITLGAAASTAVTVNLVSSDLTELQVPASVVIPAGQTAVTFPITVINDTAIDGPQTVVITASVPGWNEATATIQVTDNETRNLTLSAPGSLYEGGTGSGSVYLSGSYPTPLVVTLTSSSPARYAVPASVTIPAGQTSANFLATAVDDQVTNGTQSFTLTAAAATFTSATATGFVYDNDVHHFSFSTVAALQKTGVPFSIMVQAKDVNNVTITPFTGTVALSAAGDGGTVALTPAVSGAFSSGSWTGSVTATTPRTNVRLTATSGALTGTSNAFEVQLSPAIALSPASHELTLNQGQTATRTLTIGNTGGGTLTWSMATAATLAEVVSEGPVFVGAAPAGLAKTEADAALGPPAAASIHAEPRPPENFADVLATLPLPTALTNLNFNSNLVRSAIPGRYAFTEGVTGTYISDGGNDMYDGGNYLGTNLGANLSYSDNLIASNAFLGAGGQYFTRKYDGLWVFAANVSGLSYFEITGDLGADGSGSTDSAVLAVVRDGVTYRGFVKRVYAAGDPSVNHLVIVADNGSVTHAVSTDTNNDYHRLTGLTGVTRIYYLLYAGTAGGYIDNTATLNLMNVFLDSITAPDWVSPSPGSGSVAAGAAQNVTLNVSAANLSGGIYTRTLVVTSNDPAQPSASVPVTLTVSALPNLAVSPATGLSASGLRGGPFTPAAQGFTLTNTGAQALGWTAAKTAAWLDLSANAGSLNPGASVTVTATLNAAASALASGAFTDTLTFTNTTNGLGNTTRPVALAVTAAGDLAVTPALDLAASGPFGGPFTPDSRSYTLSNPGDAALAWTATKTAPWLTLSSTSGTLAPGATATVTATINAATTAPGSFTDTLTFTNTTTGRGTTTRAMSLAVALPAPALAPEPPATGGTSNTVSWNAVFGAAEYEVQAAIDAAFTSPLSSGWIAGTTHTFAGLSDGVQYRYRVRARRPVSGALGSWTQTGQAEFSANTAANVSSSSIPGSVVLSLSNGVLTENFDQPGADWSGTIFPNISAGTFERTSLSGSGPNTTPALPVNQGGDLEARLSGTRPSALLADTAQNRFADGGIEAWIAPGHQTALHYAGLLLRASRTNGYLNGYGALLIFFDNGTVKADFTRITNGSDNTLSTWFYTNTTTFTLGANENIRAQFSIAGSVLTLRLWRVSVVAGVVTETPIAFYQGGNTLTATDTTYPAAGLAGIYDSFSNVNQSTFDDVTVTGTAAAGTYAAAGTSTSPVIGPSPWHRWGALTFTKDTSAAGTALTVDVLNASGTLLAANVASGTDLHAIPAIASQPAIRLRANLSTTNPANTPRLDDWSVTWQTAPASVAESAWSPVVTSLQDSSAPVLTVTSPYVTLSPLVPLAGLATDFSGIASLTVNGTPALTADGFAHWSAATSIALVPGWNPIALAATDTAAPANALARAHAIYLTTPTGDADFDGLPDIWEAAHGLDAFSSAGDSGALGDFDKDGLLNLLERAFGLNPAIPEAAGAPRTTEEINPADGLRYLVVRYRRLLAPAGLTYAVEVSPDLGTWSADAVHFAEIPPPVPNADGLTETVAVRVLPAIGSPGQPGGYVRIRVTAPLPPP